MPIYVDFFSDCRGWILFLLRDHIAYIFGLNQSVGVEMLHEIK